MDGSTHSFEQFFIVISFLITMFDKEYKEEKLYWGRKPDDIVKLILKYKKKGDVLDLGVGEGRNALFLAEQGFNVTGVDISKEGIEKLKKLAKLENLNINAINEDIRKFKFNKKYDIIISNATLHFLEKEEIEELIRKMRQNTKESGLNIISAFTKDNPNKNFPYLFKKLELKSYYHDWKILGYKESITPLEKHGKKGKWHSHGIALIIAQNS